MLVGIFSLTGGVVVANDGVMPHSISDKPVNATTEKPVSDLQWAASRGLFSADASSQQTVTQAEFLRMLLTVYKPIQQGVIVPHGVENHWAAPIYATAKNEALFDCSCQVKPDDKMKLAELSKFIVKGINQKAKKELVNFDQVMEWTGKKDKNADLATYEDVAVLLKKMEDTYVSNHLLKEERMLDEKNDESSRE